MPKLSSLGSFPFFSKIKKIAERIRVNLYLVGGPLRDILLKRRVKDIDLAVDGDSFKFASELAKSLKGEVFFYPQFLTAKVKWKGRIIDIARTRKEVYEKPAQLPKVTPAGIEEDLKRRDFTINAIAYDIRKEEILDPFTGKRDLEKGIIRVIHPKSFIDDPTRIIRGIRFAKRFGFEMEKNTLRWAKEAIEGSFFSLLSGERFLQELKLIMKEKNWLMMIKEINRLGIFKSYLKRDLPEEAIKGLNLIKRGRNISSELFLFYLLSFFPQTERLPLTREEKREIFAFRKLYSLKRRLSKARRPSTICQILKGFPISSLRLIKELFAKEEGDKIREFLKRYRKVKTILTGKELKGLGIKPEVKYSEFLTKILYQRLDKKIKTRKEELRYLRRLLRKYG
ncbi:MAG: hypothetical protein ABIK81_01805 [candidate division WOR-3 bacterium]